MGQSVSSPIRENIDTLHNQLMKHAGADYDIATATTLSYSQFVTYITDLNKICSDYKDNSGCVLVFAIKKDSDSSVFWKATVRVACVKLNTITNSVETHRLLTIRQFLQVFRRISYECTDGAVGMPSLSNEDSTAPPSNCVGGALPPTVAASLVLNESKGTSFKQTAEGNSLGKGSPTSVAGPSKRGFVDDDLKKEPFNSGLEECVICLERTPDVILPCCHAYCLPCIEQWWEYCDNAFDDECLARSILEQMNVVDKSCPVCRESLSSTEDTWILPEIPDKSEVSEEIKRSLISFASSERSKINNTSKHENS